MKNYLRSSWRPALPLLFAALLQDPAAAPPAPVEDLFHQAVEWSPDGRQLAFSEYSGGEKFSFEAWSISIIDVDGSNRRKVADKGIFLSWAPDGERLVFDSRGEQGWDLYTVRTDGSERTRITTDEFDNDQPAWSPTGDRIAFRSNREDKSSLYLFDLETDELTRLTENDASDFNPAWSPDGRELTFFREKGDRMDQVHVVDLQGAERRVTDGTGHNIYPSFLPDGRVGFTSVATDGTKRVAVAGPEELTLEADSVSYARWSPDGETVAFVGGRWPKSAIYLMDSDGSDLRKLVN